MYLFLPLGMYKQGLYERNETCFQIFAHLGGRIDCVTVSCTGVAGYEQKFVPFPFTYNRPSLFNRFCKLSAILLYS